MGFHSHTDGGRIQKKQVTQYSRASVLWVVKFQKETTTEILNTSMRTLRTQNSYFVQFTQQISSVSTEQLLDQWQYSGTGNSFTSCSGRRRIILKSPYRWNSWRNWNLSLFTSCSGRYRPFHPLTTVSPCPAGVSHRIKSSWMKWHEPKREKRRQKKRTKKKGETKKRENEKEGDGEKEEEGDFERKKKIERKRGDREKKKETKKRTRRQRKEERHTGKKKRREGHTSWKKDEKKAGGK